MRLSRIKKLYGSETLTTMKDKETQENLGKGGKICMMNIAKGNLKKNSARIKNGKEKH